MVIGDRALLEMITGVCGQESVRIRQWIKPWRLVVRVEMMAAICFANTRARRFSSTQLLVAVVQTLNSVMEAFAIGHGLVTTIQMLAAQCGLLKKKAGIGRIKIVQYRRKVRRRFIDFPHETITRKCYNTSFPPNDY